MPEDTIPGKPTMRCYSTKKKAAAVRMVRTLRTELGTDRGAVKRVEAQLAYVAESVRSWVRQADVNEGHAAGVSTKSR